MGSINLALINPQLHPKLTPHRVVPVRFARAVDGECDDTAPDLDDHGFTIPAQFCSAHGPVVGLMGPAAGEANGPEIRIKVMRDRISDTAKLFPTVDDASVAKITFPVGAELSAADVPATATSVARKGDCVFLQAATTSESETKLKIHFGSADGPVLAECAVRVYPRLVINVQIHLVSINGTAPSSTFDSIKDVFKKIGKVYAPAGVAFEVAPAPMNEAVTGYARPGTVTLTAVPDERNIELQTVLNQHPVQDSLNAYVFGHYFDTVSGLTDDTVGIAFSVDQASAPSGAFPGCQPGLTLCDFTDPIAGAHTAAHETGHSLRLIHYGNVNNPGRADIWAHRNLMHPIIGIDTSPPPLSDARAEVGYAALADGRNAVGDMLMIKPRAGVQQSNQVDVLRAAQVAGSYKPIIRGTP